ncbi:MAG: cupin domain-containing protein [Patescibacteria group bacterium]
MKGYVGKIEQLTRANSNFRTVLYTGKHSQLVLMSLKPSEEIGEEVHADNDQFFRFESGMGKVVIDGVSHDVSDGVAVIVPAGAKHNMINTSTTDMLKMYTLYSPAHHRDGVIHRTRSEALADDEHFEGVTSE